MKIVCSEIWNCLIFVYVFEIVLIFLISWMLIFFFWCMEVISLENFDVVEFFGVKF